MYSFSIITSLKPVQSLPWNVKLPESPSLKSLLLSWRMFCWAGVSAVLPLFPSCTTLLAEPSACGTRSWQPTRMWQHLKFLTDKNVRKRAPQLPTCLCLLFKEQNGILSPLETPLAERECPHFHSVATSFSLLVITSFRWWMQDFFSPLLYKSLKPWETKSCRSVISQSLGFRCLQARNH